MQKTEMKDKELRGLILNKFYDLRRRGPFQWAELSQEELDPAFLDLVGGDLFRICDQLAEKGLIDWNAISDGSGKSCGGHGKISAYGTEVVEGSDKPPMAITF